MHQIPFLRQRPHYAGEIWKYSFISTVRPSLRPFRNTLRPSRSLPWLPSHLLPPSLYISPPKHSWPTWCFFFLSGGLSCTLILHENETLRKRSWNWRNLKTPTFRFRVDAKILKTELFENDGVRIIMWFPIPSLLQTQIQNERWLHAAFLNSSGTGVEGKHTMRFQSKTSVFKSAQGLSHSIKIGFLETNYGQSDGRKSYIYE